MINYKCKNCACEMSVNEAGELQCSYCGSKFVLSDKDLRGYKEFRYHLLSYLSALSDCSGTDETDRIWSRAESLTLYTQDGKSINIHYLFRTVRDGITLYTCRNKLIVIFSKGSADAAERFVLMISKLKYPPADLRGLERYFPSLSGRFTLENGQIALAFSKSEESYPLAAFGSLPPEHAAWIVSRLENICCVLAYSDLSHGGINMDNVLINPRTHEAFLFGGWHNALVCEGGSVKDLMAIRETAKRVMGLHCGEAPTEFSNFISNPPAKSAFDDFALWDTVIRDGFQGRRFKKLDLNNLNV